MHILSKESFESISYLIENQSYGNIVARLEVDLPAEDSHFFSRFRQEGSIGTWYTEESGPFRPFKEASPQEQELIAIEIETRRNSILEKMQAKMPYVNSLFSIPSDDQIFFHTDAQGDIHVTLAQWGFKARGGESSIDILTAIISRPRTLTQTDVWIQVLYSDGLPAAQANLFFHLFNALNDKPFKTDTDGKFHMGNLINGKDFSISDGNGHEEHFVVIAGQNLYVVNIPYYTAYDITVQNQEGTRKANYPLILDDIELTTDDQGIIRMENVLLTPDKQILARNREDVSQSYSLGREGNKFLFEVVDRFTSNLTVKVRYDSGEPLPKRTIRIGATDYITDAEGCIAVSGLEPESMIRVQDSEFPAAHVEKTLARGDNEVELVIEKPKPPMVRVRVFDPDKQPITDIHLFFDTKLGPLEAVTDSDGAVYFPKELFSDKERVKLHFEYAAPKNKKEKEKK